MRIRDDVDYRLSSVPLGAKKCCSTKNLLRFYDLSYIFREYLIYTIPVDLTMEVVNGKGNTTTED